MNRNYDEDEARCGDAKARCETQRDDDRTACEEILNGAQEEDPLPPVVRKLLEYYRCLGDADDRYEDCMESAGEEEANCLEHLRYWRRKKLERCDEWHGDWPYGEECREEHEWWND